MKLERATQPGMSPLLRLLIASYEHDAPLFTVGVGAGDTKTKILISNIPSIDLYGWSIGRLLKLIIF